MKTNERKTNGIAIAIVTAVLLVFAYLALLNGRYYYVGSDTFGYQVFDKWECSVIEIEYDE